MVLCVRLSLTKGLEGPGVVHMVWGEARELPGVIQPGWRCGKNFSVRIPIPKPKPLTAIGSPAQSRDAEKTQGEDLSVRTYLPDAEVWRSQADRVKCCRAGGSDGLSGPRHIPYCPSSCCVLVPSVAFQGEG